MIVIPIRLFDLDSDIPISISLLVFLSIQLLAERCQGIGREDHLDGQSKTLANAKGQVQTGIVLLPFEISNGLDIDPDVLSESLPRYPPLLPQHGDPVIKFPAFHIINIFVCCKYTIEFYKEFHFFGEEQDFLFRVICLEIAGVGDNTPILS